MRLLLLSNSTNPGEPYLGWGRGHIAGFLAERARRVLLVPFAGVTTPWPDYAAAVRTALGSPGMELVSAHDSSDAVAELSRCDAVVVGGGNTFHLLTHLYSSGLLDAIRQRVRQGLPYVGWSAGSNVACPTIGTTNDMPIVEPPHFEALGLVPFQINAHYTEARLPDHGGESRPQRLAEYVAANPGRTVVGLPEGSGLLLDGTALSLVGAHPPTIFRAGMPPRLLEPGTDLAFLLEPDAGE
jgi:dipeptidase E